VALGAEVDRLLAGRPGAVWDLPLAREFERILIRHGCWPYRPAGASKRRTLLGIGRNTITRKIQELGMENGDAPPPGEG
jgi:two-component system nitrogen regulation response regulator GlnG